MPCTYEETAEEIAERNDKEAARKYKPKLDLLTKGLCQAMRYMEKKNQLDQFDADVIAWFNVHKAADEKRKMKEEGPKLLKKYMGTYAGQHLKYKMTDKGMWHVEGEDSNCDMGGSHHNPHIGYVEGTFEKALLWAVVQKNFWAWGAGGKLTRITDVTKV